MDTYRLEDYSFELPEDRIAQHPAAQRDKSRLMVAQLSGVAQHARFEDLGEWLRPGDVLVLNQTRVINARCFAFKENGVRIEVFILGLQGDPARTPVLARPAKRVKTGVTLNFPNANVHAEALGREDDGRLILKFPDQQALIDVIEKDGELPLPPYIQREQGPSEDDKSRYQTVFASDLGAVAAPTAGLHFTQDLLEQLTTEKHIDIAYVTHHVGIGTFKPVSAEDIRDHAMDREHYVIDEQTADKLNRAKKEGRRIIAVGTTCTRCLESNYGQGFHAGSNSTNHYIYPGYTFKAINGLITNFHLPGSTLILLVSALMGRERILELYREAIAQEYRFYSFGDAMLLLPE